LLGSMCTLYGLQTCNEGAEFVRIDYSVLLVVLKEGLVSSLRIFSKKSTISFFFA
jgi:hypothetical protein